MVSLCKCGNEPPGSLKANYLVNNNNMTITIIIIIPVTIIIIIIIIIIIRIIIIILIICGTVLSDCQNCSTDNLC